MVGRRGFLKGTVSVMALAGMLKFSTQQQSTDKLVLSGHPDGPITLNDMDAIDLDDRGLYTDEMGRAFVQTYNNLYDNAALTLNGKG